MRYTGPQNFVFLENCSTDVRTFSAATVIKTKRRHVQHDFVDNKPSKYGQNKLSHKIHTRFRVHPYFNTFLRPTAFAFWSKNVAK